MRAKATEHDQPALPAAAGAPAGRFARDPAEFALPASTHLTLIRSGRRDTDSQERTP